MKQFYIFSIALIVPLFLNGQQNKVPLLEREINISVNNEPLYKVLDAISQQADFVFSYNSESIEVNSVISLNINQKSVRQALNTIFKGTVKYKARGKYIILQKDELYAESLKNSNQKMTIEGYITETGTGNKLNEVTVYNKDKLASATSDKYGYFKIELPPDRKNSELHISKMGYSDTLIAKIERNKNYIDVELSTNKNETGTDSSGNRSFLRNISFSNIGSGISKWFISQKLWINSLNIKDTVIRMAQLSFLPNIGTNKLFSGNAVNYFSLNIIAGYTQEIKGFEIGGVQNIVRNNVQFAQVAGVGNIVGGSFEGGQLAGIYNLTSGSFTGTQVGGIFNVTRSYFNGSQISGIWNNAGASVNGLQLSGVYNRTPLLNGVQIGGILNIVSRDSGMCQIGGVTNIAGKTFEGSQIAGVNNIADHINGVQIGGVANTAIELSGTQVAGVINTVSKVEGTQIAGVINLAEKVDGVQISGTLNIASSLKGTQISVINFADSCDGVPIGLISIVKKGYHKIEISADEIFNVNLAFRTGTRNFHNILFAGFRPYNFENSLWTYGYGLGTSFGTNKKFNYDLDITMQQIINNNKFSSVNDLFKIYFGIDLTLIPKVSLSAGMTCNLLITDATDTSYSKTFSKLAPYSIINNTSQNGTNFKIWLGGRVAIRFL
jgi:hypothetical protein